VKRIPSLDGLRAISIALVVAGHLGKSGHAPKIFWDVYAALGVKIFFVISGYLITTILLREHDRTSNINLREFYIRRAYRIFPAALVFMLIMFVAYWHQMRWYNMAAAMLYVANLDIHRPWILGHLWSLSIEEQFYLAWPGVLKQWYRHRTAILLGVCVLAPLCQVAFYWFKLDGGGPPTLPTVADNLAAGCLIAIFASRIPRISRLAFWLMVAGILLIPLYSAHSVARTLFMLFVLRPLLHLSIAGVLVHVVQSPYRILNWGPVVWFGQISYSLYLWQQPFCSDPALRSGYLAVFAFLCAALSFYLVEQPVLRLREKRVPASAKCCAALPDASAMPAA
jgi:peptidoglycan/LPS O-acetylase OafA/YrhL